jgi:hypothetical protein
MNPGQKGSSSSSSSEARFMGAVSRSERNKELPMKLKPAVCNWATGWARPRLLTASLRYIFAGHTGSGGNASILRGNLTQYSIGLPGRIWWSGARRHQIQGTSEIFSRWGQAVPTPFGVGVHWRLPPWVVPKAFGGFGPESHWDAERSGKNAAGEDPALAPASAIDFRRAALIAAARK